MNWIYILVIGAVIVILGYFVVTSIQQPSSTYAPTTDYNLSTTYNIPIGSGGGQQPMSNPDTNNSVELPTLTSTQVNTGTMQGKMFTASSSTLGHSPSTTVIQGTGQFAGDKWIVGPSAEGAGRHIQAT